MQAYFDRRYSPGNVTLVGVGKVDFRALVAKAEAMCSAWRPFDVSRELPAPPTGARRRIHADPKVARQQVAMACPAPTSQDPARYAAMLAATIVGDSTGSRLFYALVDPAIVDEAGMAYDALDGAGMFMTFLSADADQAARALQIARDEVRRFLDGGPTDAEMQAAKNKIASAATLKGEVPMGRLTAVGYDWLYRREYVPLAEQIETLFAVPAEEVLAVARKYNLAESTLVTLGPLEDL
jgi:predicted Zn-dependent peptidase